jgi:hypothetical protein
LVFLLFLAGIFVFVALWPWFLLSAFRRMAKAQENMARAFLIMAGHQDPPPMGAWPEKKPEPAPVEAATPKVKAPMSPTTRAALLACAILAVGAVVVVVLLAVL